MSVESAALEVQRRMAAQLPEEERSEAG